MTKNLFFPLVLVFLVASINLSMAQLHISERRFSPLNETFEREREGIREEWRKLHASTTESKADGKDLKSYHQFL